MSVSVGQLAVKIAGMAAIFAAALFLPAGTLAWPAGWVFLALFVAFTIALSSWLGRHDPALLEERMTGFARADKKSWDRTFIALTTVAFYGWLALMALDAARFHWSRVPLWTRWVGGALLCASFYLFFLTFRENSYLSPTVRVQRERAQTVVSTGPYRYVRHPMYAAFLVFALGTALMLGSWYGLPGGAVIGAMVAWRAVREERLLRDELPGYLDYMSRVRYRLVPRVW